MRVRAPVVHRRMLTVLLVLHWSPVAFSSSILQWSPSFVPGLGSPDLGSQGVPRHKGQVHGGVRDRGVGEERHGLKRLGNQRVYLQSGDSMLDPQQLAL